MAAVTETSRAKDENRRSTTRPIRPFDRTTELEQNPAVGQRGFAFRSQPGWRDQGVSMSTDTNRQLCSRCGTVGHVIAMISVLQKIEVVL